MPESGLYRFSAKFIARANGYNGNTFRFSIGGTELYSMMERGEYAPLSLEEAVQRTKIMYEILEDAGINIIRVGLKASEIMENEIGFHPAFRQLVESDIAKDRIEAQLAVLPDGSYSVLANSHSFGNIYGHKGANREYFAKKYPHLILKGAADESLSDNQYKVIPAV